MDHQLHQPPQNMVLSYQTISKLLSKQESCTGSRSYSDSDLGQIRDSWILWDVQVQSASVLGARRELFFFVGAHPYLIQYSDLLLVIK